MKSFFDNQNLLALIWKWKTHLITIGAIAIVGAALFSSPWFITPMFESQARIYPTNTSTYSEESESEQMLEVLNSTDLKWQIIHTFKLQERFNIKPDEAHFRTKILKEYNDRIACKKTEYESIELTALDADPQVASDLVDSLIVFYNRKVLSLNREKAREQAAFFMKDLNRKRKEIEAIAAEMEPLRKEYGLLDYEIQAEQVTQGYMSALAGGANSRAIADIKNLMTNLEEKGGRFFLLQKELLALEMQRDTIASRYDKALARSEKNVTYTMVVEEPFPADKKAYPIRWLIVVVSFLAVEFLAVLTILGLEGIQSSKP
ncbi:GumC domain-containing protein [Sunxiuqinia dokdonensis]|uniref:Polysaccharide chain length determinant N-terminal domain-containing protein n=1 Tax=Sunxiuqinia dokdonensis TaxID=1409788 RepID=A0A0L8V7L4_9BACT|nr:hypothetical protein [Sunxiuqinia dokdonensis]KOH44475.1 hypothetical protein NC99_27050 [Sunxiuqinia dokdonensis]